MHPRITMLALTGVILDLLCVAAVGAVLLLENPWLEEIGMARFWLVVTLTAGGLVPIMYGVERAGVARRLGDNPERMAAAGPAWAAGRSARGA